MKLNDYILIIFIILAIYFDLTQRKIPNFITFPVILWGLFTYTVFDGFQGLKFSLLGFLTGLGIFLIPFILGGMGGGDVKFLAAIGALKGWRFALSTGIYTALAGGVIVIIYLIYKRRLGITLMKLLGILLMPLLIKINIILNKQFINNMINYFNKLEIKKDKDYIPYGVAIGCGALIVLFGLGNNLFNLI